MILKDELATSSELTRPRGAAGWPEPTRLWRLVVRQAVLQIEIDERGEPRLFEMPRLPVSDRAWRWWQPVNWRGTSRAEFLDG